MRENKQSTERSYSFKEGDSNTSKTAIRGSEYALLLLGVEPNWCTGDR
jgi:hypothetical protein